MYVLEKCIFKKVLFEKMPKNYLLEKSTFFKVVSKNVTQKFLVYFLFFNFKKMSNFTFKVNFMYKTLAWYSTSHLLKIQKRKVLVFINVLNDFPTKIYFWKKYYLKKYIFEKVLFEKIPKKKTVTSESIIYFI